MLISEFRQHVGLDRVTAKGLFELLQPETPQPRCDVHLLLRPAFIFSATFSHAGLAINEIRAPVLRTVDLPKQSENLPFVGLRRMTE
jgi:hypothetical protein